MLGLYVSDHPLLGVDHILRSNTDMSISALQSDESTPDGMVTLGGLITGVQRKVYRQGSSWAIVSLEDLEGAIEVLFFSNTYNQYALTLIEDRVVTVRGRFERRDEVLRFTAL
jgi:DNA polymerase-3 subunit alpha